MVCGTRGKQDLVNEAGNAVASIHYTFFGPARGEVTFVLQPLQYILPTSKHCYVRELKGRVCIIDELRRPQNGDTVLMDMSGFLEWGSIYLHPRRIVTDGGIELENELLEDVALVGVVTHEVTAIYVETAHQFDRNG